MEISSYTSNIQPYGSQSGTKLASESDSTRSISAPRETDRSDKLSEQISEQVKERQAESIEAAKKLAKERERISEEQRSKIMEQMQEFVSSINKGLSFRVDQETGRDIVTIYEADTGDVIRQIPEEEMLEVLRRLARDDDHRSGLLATKA
ncbi:flagellar protein FlaG [Vibrio sp.]|uniref:Flagellar protein FlaG n=1 Tax=Vibrio viridaestus TaxID=2487322 RepID=A0A3N9TJH6_9VIBR|nr:flagellar protein FlaG [Vibrio viridaestus]MDC0611053.1 flagellar protein FlaG [Vibrio sp.]RQW64094.1 flagellar protein FlaG [Vibrio viridaestus]